MTTHSLPTGRAIVLTYLLVVVLAAASWIAASLGTGTGLALAIAAVKTIAIALVFMELIASPASDRVIAVIAVLFVALMCAGLLGDVAFR